MSSNSLFIEIQFWMAFTHNHPAIESFFQGLKSLFSSISSSIDYNSNQLLYRPFRSQAILDWKPFINRFISRNLVAGQQHYYSEISSRKSGIRYYIRLIAKLWHITLVHWKHRNSILHEIESTKLLSGLESLKVEVTNELPTRLDQLPYV